MMEDKFSEKFSLKKKANDNNLNYRKPSKEMAEYIQKTKEKKEKASENVIDIMYQMMYDEKKFGLD